MNYKIYFILNLILIIFILSFYSCVSDAPRDNILDPESDKFQNVGKLSGTVSTYYQPFSPLENAFLITDPLGISTQTDVNGNFKFSDIPSGIYTIRCFSYGYRSDSTIVQIDNNHHDINFNLNAIPAFDSIKVNSHHVSRWFPAEDFYYLSIEADLSDKDGINEIDSVKINIPSISYEESLFTDGFSGRYFQSIMDNQLPVQNIRSLEGVPMRFVCWDRVGNKTTSIDKFIPRIVQDVPVIISPTSLEIINSFPHDFSWQPIYLDYDFSLKIEIYQINIGIFTKVREYKNISSTESTHTVTQSLPNRDYFWIIYIVDEFGDTSSSKEGSFRVQ